MGKKYSEVGEQQFRFVKPGDELEGTLKYVEASALGVNFYHIIPDGKNLAVGVLGSVGLDRLMKELNEGDIVKIVYDEIVTTRDGNRFKVYRVFKAE